MPLGRGMVTSTFADNAMGAATDSSDSRQKTIPRFSDVNRETNTKIIEQFGALAAKHGCTTSQLALAWLLKQGNDVIPIPGTKRVKYLEENWKATMISLSDTDEADVRGFLESAEVAGGVMPVGFESYNYVDTVEEA